MLFENICFLVTFHKMIKLRGERERERERFKYLRKDTSNNAFQATFLRDSDKNSESERRGGGGGGGIQV